MRYWNNSKPDDGSIHSIGNGYICAYGLGPNIIQIFGTPLSLPSLMSLTLVGDECIESEGERTSNLSVWQHILKKDGVKAGKLEDFTVSGKPCFIRTLELTSSLCIRLTIEKGFVLDNSKAFKDSGINNALLVTAGAGTYFYANLYSSPYKAFYQISIRGNVETVWEKDSNSCIFTFHKGKSLIIISGGTDYPNCIENCKMILKSDLNSIKKLSENADACYSEKRLDFKKLIPDNFPDKANLMKTIDDTAMLIRTQSDISGSVLAGHNYHLAYVRDQFGVTRCLLDLGYYEEVKNNLTYYFNIFKIYGRIRNAQSLGFDGIFHTHENDDVEITGYLIIQAFDYLKKTSDTDFINYIMPMLKWAYEAQISQLKGFMLPFNGDETYIAGGILPRSILNDGSAEATLLFITSGKLLLNYIENHGSWEKLDEYKRICFETQEHYRENFFINGEFVANNPLRKKYLELPKYRHGVCERCNAFGWTSKNENNRYLCVSCYQNFDLPKAEDKIYTLLSVGLVPVFIDSDVLSKSEIKKILDKIMDFYERTGRLPSSPGGSNSVGYDYGFLLYALSCFRHPKAYEIYNKMMLLLDETGAWVEYYIDEKPAGTRCRPWESGINLSAAIRYALNYKYRKEL